MKRTLSLFLAAVLAFGLLAGCGRPGDNYKKQGGKMEPVTQPATFKVGLVPGVEALPLWIAEQKEYFQQSQLTVELVSFPSAQARDAAMAAGSIDGMLADLVEAVAVIGGGAKAKIVAATVGAKPGEQPVLLLAGKGAGIAAVSGLSGKQISLPPGTAMRYAAEQILSEQGLKPADVTFVEAASAGALVESLAAGEVTAALLPEPYASLAAGRGAVKLASEDEAKQNLTQAVLVFSEAAISGQGPAISRFFGANNLAAADLAVKHDPHIDLLAEKTDLTVLVKVVYDRAFPSALTLAPQEADVTRAVEWLAGKQLMQTKPAKQFLDLSLLPQAQR